MTRLIKKRINKIRDLLLEKQLCAILINSYENYRYFSGFTGSNAYLIITQDDLVLITDQRYTSQANEQAKLYEIISHGINPFVTFKEQFSRLNLVKVGFESTFMSVNLYTQFCDHFPKSKFEPLKNEFLNIRKIKDSDEIKIIKESVKISDKAFADLLPIIKPGMSEIEILIELEYIKMKLGNESPAFGTIIASDIRAALPHAKPTDNEVKMNDLLLIDYGVTYQGYMSDMTRTIWVGEPSYEMQRIYELVVIAIDEAVAAVRPGISCQELDYAARKVFLHSGVEQYSLRGLGHGVGLQIHESPRVVLDNEELIEEGMVLTIEPGLYLPGKGGVRLEDMVLVTKDGCEVLTNTDRHIQLSLMG